MASYAVYLLRCSDDTFYTGITTDLSRRLREHNESPRGAHYTKTRRPVTLVYQEPAVNRTAAQQREYRIRTLTRSEKMALARKNSQATV